MRVIGIILIVLGILSGIGSFGEFDNRAQAGGSIIGAALFGIVGVILLLFSGRKNKTKQ